MGRLHTGFGRSVNPEQMTLRDECFYGQPVAYPNQRRTDSKAGTRTRQSAVVHQVTRLGLAQLYKRKFGINSKIEAHLTQRGLSAPNSGTSVHHLHRHGIGPRT